MRPRTNPVFRIERVASLAAAIGLTLGAALLVVVGPGHFLVRYESAPVRETRQVSEHLVYVAQQPPVPLDAPTRQAARSSARSESVAVSTSHEPTAPRVDSAAVTPRAAVSEPALGTTSPSRVPAGAPAMGASAGFRRPSAPPIRVDSAMGALGTALETGLLKPPPFTQAELDAKWRAEAFEVVAARGVGDPVRRSTAAGGSIPVPLPFGGPSRKQRERDRAIYAELKATMPLRQARVDSVVAARQRRRADSLAHVGDSLARGTRPEP